MTTTTFLTTRRLTLRPLSVDDAAALSGLLKNDSAAIQMTSHIPDPCTLEGARAWIAMRSGADSYPFAIEAVGTMIGVIGFHVKDATASMGYSIGRAYWSQGYATEAATEGLRFATTLGVRRVEADTFVENAASVRVLKKIGFTYIDTVDEEQPVRGGVRKVHRFEWVARDAFAHD
jgi:RimJ/RimL family protein N-acetyltransferase